MCGPDAYQVAFPANQSLPDPYLVEGLGGVYYGCTVWAEWIGPDRDCRFAARRDALEHLAAKGRSN